MVKKIYKIKKSKKNNKIKKKINKSKLKYRLYFNNKFIKVNKFDK